jgi:hypothetical protein
VSRDDQRFSRTRRRAAPGAGNGSPPLSRSRSLRDSPHASRRRFVARRGRDGVLRDAPDLRGDLRAASPGQLPAALRVRHPDMVGCRRVVGRGLSRAGVPDRAPGLGSPARACTLDGPCGHSVGRPPALRRQPRGDTRRGVDPALRDRCRADRRDPCARLARDRAPDRPETRRRRGGRGAQCADPLPERDPGRGDLCFGVGRCDASRASKRGHRSPDTASPPRRRSSTGFITKAQDWSVLNRGSGEPGPSRFRRVLDDRIGGSRCAPLWSQPPPAR